MRAVRGGVETSLGFLAWRGLVAAVLATPLLWGALALLCGAAAVL